MGENKLFYIDGSCNNQKTGKLSGVGGVGVIEVREEDALCKSFGPYPNVTSAKMEVMGLLHCLRHISITNGHVTIYCDNQYVVYAKMKNWYTRWIVEYRTHGSDRANIELWDQIWEEIRKLAEIGTFIELKWVKGHAGNQFNELADVYADRGRKEGRSEDIILLENISKIINKKVVS